MAITFDQARQIAQQKIGPKQGLIESATVEKPYGWYFLSQSREYIESGNIRDMLIGNAGFIVEKASGQIWEFWSAETLERQFEDYEICSHYGIREANDLTIISVRDKPRALELLLALDMSQVIPEEAYGTVWRIPLRYSQEQIRQALEKLPCRFAGQNFQRSCRVFQELDRSGCCRYELRLGSA